MRKILFIVPPKAHLLDVNGPAHIFYEAREFGAGVELFFVSVNDITEAESSAGLTFSKLTPYHNFEITSKDFVFVPGLEYKQLSNSSFLKESHGFFSWLKKQHVNGANICSICTGAFLLAEAGIFTNKSCTTHWKYFALFNQKYPDVPLKKDRLFVVEGNTYSSAGVSSGIDLALYIIEDQFGTKFAADVAKEVVLYFRRSESDPQLSIFLQYRNHLDNRIHDAQNWMTESISKDFTIEDVADTVNMSARNLTRCFKKVTGITIGSYLEKLRVERAFQLIANGNKVEYVSQECGLKSTNQLRSLLKKHHGVLPGNISST